mmetsp:Transcript_22076/g.56376  ORF Transcript_22076/g.56376 Transcript_22076/m.56376 type:complete len:202 (+) Transcript_22076:135-740(+)
MGGRTCCRSARERARPLAKSNGENVCEEAVWIHHTIYLSQNYRNDVDADQRLLRAPCRDMGGNERLWGTDRSCGFLIRNANRRCGREEHAAQHIKCHDADIVDSFLGTDMPNDSDDGISGADSRAQGARGHPRELNDDIHCWTNAFDGHIGLLHWHCVADFSVGDEDFATPSVHGAATCRLHAHVGLDSSCTCGRFRLGFA